MENQFKPTHSGTPPEPPKDARVQITKTIWAFATAMMGISIAMVHSIPILPLCVLGAAAVGTVAVWLGRGGSPSSGIPITQEQLRQLEERLANVETISRFEHSLHERDSSSVLEEAHLPPSEKERPNPRSSSPISY